MRMTGGVGDENTVLICGVGHGDAKVLRFELMPSCAVTDCVGIEFVCHGEGCPHALSAGEIMVLGVLSDARFFP